MFCQNCGTVLRADAKFCGECGREVATATVAEKPLSFEEFRASRTQGNKSFSSAASSSGATALDVQFQAAQKAKRKERFAHFKPKGKKKSDETVKVGVVQIPISVMYILVQSCKLVSICLTYRHANKRLTLSM